METNIDRCARCGGRMATEKDWAGAFLTCVMCGHVVNDMAISDLRFKPISALAAAVR